jgi:hypothetical protein
MGKRYLRMPYKYFVLETVKEENTKTIEELRMVEKVMILTL